MKLEEKNGLLSENIVLFDGVCNLCNGAVQWILLRDGKRHFRFAALQSDTGQYLCSQLGINASALNTVVVIARGRAFVRSDAALEICRGLGKGWNVFLLFYLIPRILRDGIYNWIARNRYRWFGRQEHCLIPRAEWKDRFV